MYSEELYGSASDVFHAGDPTRRGVVIGAACIAATPRRLPTVRAHDPGRS